MKKSGLAEKVARMVFNTEAIQKSWRTHMQAFGLILEPAFVDDYQAKTHLCAGLNKISKGEWGRGMDKLLLVKPHCETDADWAALHFCTGVCCELMGDRERMLEHYQEAGTYGHGFYLPYLKVAKCAMEDEVYEVAEKNFCAALDCLENAEGELPASVHTNLAAALTYMHRYDDAAAELEISKQMLTAQPGRGSVEAILKAAMGEGAAARALAEDGDTCELVENILSGKDPHFCVLPAEDEAIAAFWDWFTENEGELRELIEEEELDGIILELQEQLGELLPWLERDTELGIQPEMDKCRIILADFFKRSLANAYTRLIEQRPEELDEYWLFEIAR